MHTAQSAIAELRERILAASACGSPLRLRGAGTKDFYGEQLEGEILDLTTHRGIVSYEPSELVLTARCGTPLSQIEAALAAEGQLLRLRAAPLRRRPDHRRRDRCRTLRSRPHAARRRA